jgi:hypothetical protein
LLKNPLFDLALKSGFKSRRAYHPIFDLALKGCGFKPHRTHQKITRGFSR